MTARVIGATVCLVALVVLVLLCPVFLDNATAALVTGLDGMRDKTAEEQKAIFDKYYMEYRSARKWMNLIVYKARFDEIDVINDKMLSYYNSGIQYDDYEADLERLKSLLRELYEKTNADIANIA